MDMDAAALSGGFADTAREAARAFRASLDAMARPGTLHDVTGALPPAPLSPAAGALVLTLADTTTGLHLAPSHDTPALRGWITFHTGAPLVGPEAAVFALGTWDSLQPLDRFPIGRADYPDRSATLIVEMPSLEASGARLTGPGIKDAAQPVAAGNRSLCAECETVPARPRFLLHRRQFAGGASPHHQDRGSLMYVAVKGGERAIDNAHAWLAEERRGDPAVPELGVAQIREQLALSVNRVMAEGSLYDPDLAALAIKQARGDLIEAVFLIRAYRTTLPRFGASQPVDTGAMDCLRRVSATFKDVPGGQVLGPTFDYTHRLLDFALMAEGEVPVAPGEPVEPAAVPHVTGFLNRDGLIQQEPASDAAPGDLTREPLELPASRALRLQSLARGDEGFVLGMAYSTQRGYARNHAFVGELRIGTCCIEMEIPELGFAVEIGEVELTECETVNQFKGSKTEPPQFTRGYGLTFAQNERKAISMALVDRALRWRELGEDNSGAPAQDEEFVLMHSDNIQATGFLEHIKLPHYVDFQSELELVRKIRAEAMAANTASQEAAE
ncbi:hypothetical protein FALB51S_03082 [Frigidibacter albus]